MSSPPVSFSPSRHSMQKSGASDEETLFSTETVPPSNGESKSHHGDPSSEGEQLVLGAGPWRIMLAHSSQLYSEPIKMAKIFDTRVAHLTKGAMPFGIGVMRSMDFSPSSTLSWLQCYFVIPSTESLSQQTVPSSPWD
ncbi:hypothetical protein PAXINDRAFT_95644 [Paxillus involutus ATCC 200175]|nr:hypothetical protein PAXINDRAFT_95644 [Paxillus involutus ATCC 200175]